MTFRIVEEVSAHPSAGRPCGSRPGQPRGCNDPVDLKLFGQGSEILGDGNLRFLTGAEVVDRD